MNLAMSLTAGNTHQTLNVAANYGGRWDIVNAARNAASEIASGKISPQQLDEEYFAGHLALADGKDPDLLIRTGGEMRISNFLLWQCAYTELYFSPVLWPDFSPDVLDQAIATFQSRERRFGLTGEQVRQQSA